MLTVAYLVGLIFLGMILYRVFKVFTGFGEKNCKVCGESSEKIVWKEQEKRSVPVCQKCIEGGEKNG